MNEMTSEQPAPDDRQSRTLRIDADLLETLTATVSELVLSRNQLLQLARRRKDDELAAQLGGLNQVVSTLQEGVMKARMQPIGDAWTALPRLVQEIARATGKQIDLAMSGAETELDRQMLDRMREPLTRMVANAAEHGIEAPADRRALGKAETGLIRLSATQQGGHVVVEIADDGDGLVPERFRAKAIAGGAAAALPMRQADGRPETDAAGLGPMQADLDRIGGAIDLAGQPGRGTRLAIKLPLSLAIVSALVVEAGGQRFAVPQSAVSELVQAGGADAPRIEQLKGCPVMRLRDRLLPLVALDRALSLDGSNAVPNPYVVVCQDAAGGFGLIVDRVFDTEEIVVKPMAALVRHLAAFSGSTILGDGTVVMILDPARLAAAAGQIGQETLGPAAGAEAAAQAETSTLLLFRAGPGDLKAVPLSVVSRLERFSPDRFETAGDRMVVQYRGKLTPVIPFDRRQAPPSSGEQTALVFADRGEAMVLLVDEIVDIVETPVEICLPSDRPGSLGSAIVAGRATELIDAGHFLGQARPGADLATISQRRAA